MTKGSREGKPSEGVALADVRKARDEGAAAEARAQQVERAWLQAQDRFRRAGDERGSPLLDTHDFTVLQFAYLAQGEVDAAEVFATLGLVLLGPQFRKQREKYLGDLASAARRIVSDALQARQVTPEARAKIERGEMLTDEEVRALPKMVDDRPGKAKSQAVQIYEALCAQPRTGDFEEEVCKILCSVAGVTPKPAMTMGGLVALILHPRTPAAAEAITMAAERVSQVLCRRRKLKSGMGTEAAREAKKRIDRPTLVRACFAAQGWSQKDVNALANTRTVHNAREQRAKRAKK